MKKYKCTMCGYLRLRSGERRLKICRTSEYVPSAVRVKKTVRCWKKYLKKGR